jgi:hypothetical protein
MFLFSKPAQPPSTVPPQVSGQSDHPLARPLQSAADATGVPFDYLVKTAKRESNLNPDAKASTSSATGLFQFIEQTWLGLVKREGPNLGMGEQAEAIQRDSGGRYVVPEAEARQQILALRKDPALSARLAGLFTRENRASLREALGRDPTGGELYIAHFLGAGGARELITMAEGNPDRAAASAFPDAAAANRSIFFERNGRARSAREVYGRLVSYHDGAGPAMPAAGTALAHVDPPPSAIPETRSPLAIAPARNVTQTGQIRRESTGTGFFATGGQSAGANALRKTWINIAQSRLNASAPSFFPRGEGVKVAALNAATTPAASATDAPATPLAGFEAKFDFEDAPIVTPPPAIEPLPARRYEAVEAPLPPVRPSWLASATAPLDITRLMGRRR